jgi:hypothetical protein
MKIEGYIQHILRERLGASECLVLYDPERRFLAPALRLASDTCTVIDTSASSIRGREEATAAWLALGQSAPGARQVLVYVPRAKPLTDAARQQDPFQTFTVGGAEFPHGEGDSYFSLCLAAKPDHESRVYELFEGGAAPSFETVDALDVSASWPKLRTLLGVESPREILVGLLSPTEQQRSALAADKAWLPEYRQFAQAALGLHSHIQVGALEDVRDELGRFLLFSEFVFDLQEDLPDALTSVPRADSHRRALVYGVCEHLRDAGTHQEDYINLATRVSDQLDLPARTAGLTEFGERDTFLFEERAHLKRVAAAAQSGDFSTARTIIDHRRRSIWVQAGERGAAWVIADRGAALLQAVADLDAELAGVPKGLAALIHFYVDRGRRADTLHRHFERTVHDSCGEAEDLDSLVDLARRRHRAFADAMQKRLMLAAREEGWPVAGFARHTQVFDRHVAPALAQQRKVALFMVDALRYELAAEFIGRLPDGMKVTLEPALGQMPGITAVGMAALLPAADGKLRLTAENGELVPSIGGKRLSNPTERFDYVRGIYGDRVATVALDDLLKTARYRPKLAETVHLLLVKSTEIDTAGENLAGAALGLMGGVLERFLRATKVLQEMGFEQAVFAADHGFVLLGVQPPGDKVEKPQGQWVLSKVRCVAGSGGEGKGAACFRKQDLGVHGDLEHLAVPETLGAFTTGQTFMHSGLSLPETLIPVVTVELGAAAPAGRSATQVRLQYRGGTTDRITTRRPMIEVVLFQQDLLGGETLRFSLEARAGKKLVGQAGASANVEPATGLVVIEPGAAVKVSLRMDEAFEGAFTVTAVDPVTQVTYDTLKLTTDYLE